MIVLYSQCFLMGGGVFKQVAGQHDGTVLECDECKARCG